MDFNKKFKKIAICAVCAMTVIPTYGQDLLARQAPVDRKMKAVDTLALQEIVARDLKPLPADVFQNKAQTHTYKHTITLLSVIWKISFQASHVVFWII